MGSMDPQGVSGEGLGGLRRSQKYKALHPFKPLLQVFRGSPVVHIYNLGVRGSVFYFKGSME